MIYRILHWIVTLTLRSYFRKITVKGADHSPATGAVIFIANHPSAFMDPMVVATMIKRPLHFISAEEFMGTGLKSWIYRTQFNMIPVQRPNTTATQPGSNAEMFSKCFDVLSAGGAILIFPEGNSITENRLRKLKTGVARMAIGARIHAGTELHVPIIPVGLNYANPHRFQSDLFVNIGKPLDTSSFSMEIEDVLALTTILEQQLQKTILHIQDEELDPIVKKVQLILKHHQHLAGVDPEKSFEAQQKLIATVEEAYGNSPVSIGAIEQQLDRYLRKLKDLALSDSVVATPSVMVGIEDVMRLILGAPLFAAGFAINAMPYFATVFIFRRLKLFPPKDSPTIKGKVRPAFRGSIGLVLGMVLFVTWYAAWSAFGIWITETWWVAIPALVFFYLSGLFVLTYIHWFLRVIQKGKAATLVKGKLDLFESLTRERNEIVNALKALHHDFETTFQA